MPGSGQPYKPMGQIDTNSITSNTPHAYMKMFDESEYEVGRELFSNPGTVTGRGSKVATKKVAEPKVEDLRSYGQILRSSVGGGPQRRPRTGVRR